MKKLGTFVTSTKLLRISDPCYDKKVWCAGTLKNCEVGKWNSFLIYSDEGSWGNRVAENVAFFGDFVSTELAEKFLAEGNWKNSNISVGVDSGQCGIFDDSKYPDDETGEYGDDDSFYGKCCNLTLGNTQGGVIDFGAVSSTGYGDGSYDCLTLEKNGKIFAIRLIFLSDEEQDEYDDDVDED